ncbi:MAG: DedA family protein, partial [Chloroflexi bacterium]
MNARWPGPRDSGLHCSMRGCRGWKARGRGPVFEPGTPSASGSVQGAHQMQWWEVVRLSLSSFLEQHGVLASFIVILIEETGVPVPVPGDFLMLGVGVHARQGTVELWQALLVMELATLLGASILYVVAARAGRDLVYRYGRYIHLTPARLDQAERWLTHHGAAAIVAGRLTPGLRMATVIASGVFGVSPWRFLPSLALGAFLYILAYTLL